MLQKLTKRLHNRKGFTLIELIVVIAIIAILAAVLVPRFAGFTDSAKQKAAVSNARNVLTAVQAIASEGKDVTPDEIMNYTNAGSLTAASTDGKGYLVLDATAASASIISGTNKLTDIDDFYYCYVSGSKTYCVAIADGVVNPNFIAASTTPATGDTFIE